MKKIEKLKGMHYSAAHPVIIEKINEIIDYLNMDSPAQVGFDEQVIDQGLTEFKQALVDAYMSNTPIIERADELLAIAKKQLEGDSRFLYSVTRKAVDREREYLIDKVCEWLSEHFYDEEYQSYDNEGTWICAEEMIRDLRKAIYFL